MTVTVGDVKAMHGHADAIMAQRDRIMAIGRPWPDMTDADWRCSIDGILAACAEVADHAEALARLVKALPCP